MIRGESYVRALAHAGRCTNAIRLGINSQRSQQSDSESTDLAVIKVLDVAGDALIWIGLTI